MVARVQPFALFFFRDAQPDDDVHDLEGNEGHDTGPDQCRTHGPELADELRAHVVIADLVENVCKLEEERKEAETVLVE